MSEVLEDGIAIVSKSVPGFDLCVFVCDATAVGTGSCTAASRLLALAAYVRSTSGAAGVAGAVDVFQLALSK